LALKEERRYSANYNAYDRPRGSPDPVEILIESVARQKIMATSVRNPRATKELAIACAAEAPFVSLPLDMVCPPPLVTVTWTVFLADEEAKRISNQGSVFLPLP
jgi:hypothetical protein